MSFDTIAQSVFITNTFAAAYPEEHVRLWSKFEKEIPVKERTGAYGIDNIAYVKWLKKQKNPIVREFLNQEIVEQSF